MKIDEQRYEVKLNEDGEFVLPFEIMHEQRAMRVAMSESGILINGVNCESLLNVKFKDAFTEEDRRREVFTKFFKRFYLSNDNSTLFGVKHMGQNLEIEIQKDDTNECFIKIDE